MEIELLSGACGAEITGIDLHDTSKANIKIIKDLSGINILIKYFLSKEYGKELVKKIFFQNWLNFLEKNL